MKARHFFLIIFFIPALAAAQYTSPGGGFQVDEKSGCAPFTLTITNTNLTGAPCDPGECSIKWGDGTQNNEGIVTHLYATPGTYKLTINYTTVGTRGDTLLVTVYPNVQPAFDIYTCSGNEIQVRVTDTNYDSYFIDFGDGSPETQVPQGALPVSHNYGAGPHPPNYEVKVQGKNSLSAKNCTYASKFVVVSAAGPPAPVINQLMISSSSVIDLQFTTRQNVLYRFEISVNGGAFNNLGNLIDVSTASVPGLNTDDNFYCFRLGTVNPCVGGLPNYSPVICSADLAATAQNNANNLIWTTLTAGITNFTIEKDPGPPPPATASTTFLDTQVDCGTEYCYRIISNYTNGSTSISATRCVTAISTDIPTAIADVTSVVNGNNVDLTWQPNAVFVAESFTVLRQQNGGSFNSLENGITLPAFTDDDYSFSSQYCYRIDYTDACNNVSNPGIAACPIILSYSTNTDNDIILTWSAYTGWTGGVDHYELDKYDLQHNLIETYPTGSAITYTDTDLTDQGYYYVVRAVPNNVVNDESVSNEVAAFRKFRFAYPKAFTPDKQGPTENETFKVFVAEEFIAAFEMKIFNRWGEMIFSTTDLLKGWDGKFNGQPQPEGTYTFTATLKDKLGRTFKRDGSVMLLRKK